MNLRTALLLVLAAPLAVGSHINNPHIAENFEDDTVGQSPTEAFYTWVQGTCDATYPKIINGGLNGSGKSLHLVKGSQSGVCSAALNFATPIKPTYIEFYLQNNNDNFNQAEFSSDSPWLKFTTQAGNDIAHLAFGRVTNGAVCPVASPCFSIRPINISPTCASSTPWISAGAGADLRGNLFFKLTLDWAAGTISYDISGSVAGSFTGTKNFCITGSQNSPLTSLAVVGGSNGNDINVKWDEIYISGGDTETLLPSEEPDTPSFSPIESMKEFFVDSWQVSESTGNWLFGIAIVALILAGFAVYQNIVVTIVSTVLGAGLAVALGFFDLWVLLLIVFLIVAVGASMLFGRDGNGA